MLERYGKPLEHIQESDWILYIESCFSLVSGWRFKSPSEFDNNDGYNEVPNATLLIELDPMEIFSLGHEKLNKKDIDLKRAFIYKEYDYTDKTDYLSQDIYDQLERLIDLSRIWASHRTNSVPIALPKKDLDREKIRKTFFDYAEKHGIDSEIRSFYSGVPVADIVAGNPQSSVADERWHIYAFPNWNVAVSDKK